MSTYKTLADVIKEIEYWLRLATFLHEPLKNSLLHVLHNISNHPGYVGLPSDPNLLHQQLNQYHISVIDRLRKKKILSQEQYEKIFPTNQTKTDSSNFDITLIVFLIRNCTSLPAPKGGWSITSLPSNDQSIGANVVRAREWRNFLQHANPAEIDHVVFKKKWQEGVDIITSLGFVFDTQSLLQESLDPKNQKILNSLNYYLDLLRINVIDLQKDNKTTQQTLGDVLNEQEDLRNVVKTLQNELKAATSMKNNEEKNEPGDLVLPSVLVSVARLIGDDWVALGKEIGVESEEIEKLQANNSTNVESAKECFHLKNNRITWKKLRTSLNKIQREDISNTITKQSLITHALQEASMRLKNLYIEELVDWLIEQPFRINGTRIFDAVPREQAYVELAMLNAQELDHLWNNVDRDFHHQQQQFEKTSIQMDDILNHEDKFVIVRGIAGIGKSTMVDSFVLKWAKSQILNGGVNQKINFLFKMKCRDLNVTQDFHSVEELLKLKFPTIFRDISIADLEEISHQVLILLDGIDELKEISAFKEHSIDVSSLRANVIRELLWSQSQHLSGHRSIVCGRPEACQYIASSFSPVVPLKTIEICGFNNKSVERFIDFFHRHECQQAHLVKEKIKESDNLKVMASIPVYLWVICNIFKENVITSTINTTTELCAYSFLLFIRNHLKAIKKIDSIPLVNLCSDPDVLTITIALAKLPYKTLKERKVVFSEKDVSLMETSIKLEETGFITKHLYSDTEGFMYQFKHLVLQEFLSALWCYLNYDFNFGHVFPLISGLFGLENVKTDSILSQWLVNLRNKIMENTNLIGYLKNQLKRTKNFQKQLSDRTSELIQGNRIVISSSQSSLLSAIYEHQNKTFLSKDFQKNLSITIKNLSFQHDIRNAIYFIGMLETKEIESISIQNINNNKLPDNVCTLCELFFTGNSDEKVVAIEGGDQMKISTEVSVENGITRRQINILLCTNQERQRDRLTRSLLIAATSSQPPSTQGDYPAASRKPLTTSREQASTSLITIKDPRAVDFCHEKLLTMLCRSASKVVIDFSVSSLYSKVKEVLENITSNLDVEVVQHSLFHRNISVFDKRQLNNLEVKILQDNIKNNFKYILSKYINIKCNELNDDSFADVIKQIIPNCTHVQLQRLDSISLGGIAKFSEEIKQNQELNLCLLKSLNLSRSGLSSMHIISLSEQLVSMEEVSLKGLYLAVSTVKSLVNALKQCNHPSLKRISLQACHLSSEVFPFIVQLLQYVDELDVSRNILFPVPITEVISQVDIGRNKSLSLANCNLKNEDVQYLLPFLLNIKSLNLSRNSNLTHIATSAISRYLVNGARQNITYSLQDLDFSFCFGYSEAAYQGFLPSILYLDKIAYRYNFISAEQMSKTAEVILKRSSPIDTLDLSNTTLTDDHVMNLSPALTNIKNLHLRSAFGLSKRAMEWIKTYSITETLDFSNAGFDLDTLPQLIQICTKVKNVAFTRDRFTTELTEKLSSRLYPYKNNFLTSLYLTNCKLNDRSITPLIPCLPFIKDIGLKKNDFSEEKVRQIIQYIGDAIGRKESKLQFTILRINKLIFKLKGCELIELTGSFF